LERIVNVRVFGGFRGFEGFRGFGGFRGFKGDEFVLGGHSLRIERREVAYLSRER
jgi:hypothetical protein